MELVKHETCQQYVARRLSEGWRIVSQIGFNVILQSPEGIIRPVNLRNDVETLRPNASGDETSITSQYPDSNYHWDKVDEAVADDDGSFIYTTSTSYQRDLYNLPPHSVGAGTINSITIYFCIKVANAGYIYYAKPSQKSGSTVTDGNEVQRTGSIAYVLYSQTYTTNPATTNPYTWNEIDALQIGICSKSNGAYSRTTQVYVEIDYTVGVTFIPTVTIL